MDVAVASELPHFHKTETSEAVKNDYTSLVHSAFGQF